jgi:hypothetical protein
MVQYNKRERIMEKNIKVEGMYCEVVGGGLCPWVDRKEGTWICRNMDFYEKPDCTPPKLKQDPNDKRELLSGILRCKSCLAQDQMHEEDT